MTSDARVSIARVSFPDRAILCGVPLDEDLSLCGAVLEADGWVVHARAGFDAAKLDPWLPRRLREDRGVPEARPSSGHFADLATTLCRVSWRLVADVACARASGCFECGGRARFGAVPTWSWSVEQGRATARLTDVRGLCSSCTTCSRHEGSSWRWPTSRRVGRLAAVFGIEPDEFDRSVAVSSASARERDLLPLTVDLSILSGKSLRLAKPWSIDESPSVRHEDGRRVRVEGAIPSGDGALVELV